jgi:hypothetical protein
MTWRSNQIGKTLGRIARRFRIARLRGVARRLREKSAISKNQR